jgi:hypothetical protein
VDAETIDETKENFPSSFCPPVSAVVTLSGDLEAAIRLPNNGKVDPTVQKNTF